MEYKVPAWSNLICFALIFLTSIEGYDYKCKILEDRNQTLCDANKQDFNLILEFEKLSTDLSGTTKVLQSLIIQNSLIEELPENAFADIAFESITILGAEKLSRIHTKAFNEKMIDNLIHQLSIQSPSALRNIPPDYDLYKALNSLKNIALIEISFEDYLIDEIPDYAFNESQNNLKYLSFIPPIESFYGISSIGSNSFVGLSKLSSISFRNILILEISSNAFKIKEKSEERLFINLEDCILIEDNLKRDSFLGANRPVTINLAGNFFSYIREEKFVNFLNERIDNVLLFYGNGMNCSDNDPFVWLLMNEEQYKKQIFGALCFNGTSIWDWDWDIDVTQPPTTSPKTTTSESTVTEAATTLTPMSTTESSSVSQHISLSTLFTLLMAFLTLEVILLY